ncbi:hypothetical protein PG999_014376 [Apiospora kogelbergensis]|uniref:Uncharacterized protein n=1 Tax=Apiospora kogelbergensis TaxID=1337665 RepID=A0AAW0Q2S8_9PEZI
MGAARHERTTSTEKCKAITNSAGDTHHGGVGPSGATGRSFLRATKKYCKKIILLPGLAIRTSRRVFHRNAKTTSTKMRAPPPSLSGSFSAPSYASSNVAVCGSDDESEYDSEYDCDSESESEPEPLTFNLAPSTPSNPFAIDGRIVNRVKYPTVEDCKQVIRVLPNTTIFHSGGMAADGHLARVLEEDRPYLRGYTPLSWKHRSHDFSDFYGRNPAAWSKMSQALAEETAGVAYVLLPPGRGWANIPKEGYFWRDEIQHFSPKLKCLIRICAGDPWYCEQIYPARPPSPPPLRSFLFGEPLFQAKDEKQAARKATTKSSCMFCPPPGCQRKLEATTRPANPLSLSLTAPANYTFSTPIPPPAPSRSWFPSVVG